jgi:long-chain acyl-CoA synthetase
MEQTLTSLPHPPKAPITETIVTCAVCGKTGQATEVNLVRCNVRRYRNRQFHVWRCGGCQSLQTERVGNIAEYYRDYPIRQSKLDYFFRVWYGVVLKRLVKAGLQKGHSILDYGCNQGLFLDYLMERGYNNTHGFDPYVERFRSPHTLQRTYDWVISMDVIEHDENPQAFIERLGSLRNTTGRLCLTSPNAEGIDLSDTENNIHNLHVPYHVHILSQKGLIDLCRKEGLEPLYVFDHWYMDSWQPGTSRALFESLMEFGGNDIDLGYEPPRIDLFFKHPSLLWKLFFGFFQQPKKKDNMMVIFGNPPTPLVRDLNQSSSIPEVLARRANETPDAPALWLKNAKSNWAPLPWRTFWDQVTRLARVMLQRGLKPGDKVAVILPTSVEWEVVDKAALCCGLVVVGLEPHMAWDTMAHVIRDTSPRAFFVGEKDMAVRIANFIDSPPPLSVCLDSKEDLPRPFISWLSLEQEMEHVSSAPWVSSATADAPATYLLTSGTTGAPKGIVYTQGQLLLAAQSILAAMGPFGKDERTLAWLPMASPFQRNMNLAALLAGIPLYFVSDPKGLGTALPKVRPTLLIGVPRVYEKIYQGVLEKLERLPLGIGSVMKGVLVRAMALVPLSSQEKSRMSMGQRVALALMRCLFLPVKRVLGGQMRFMVTGSAPCREDVLIFFHALGIPLLEAYGVSECAVPLSMNRPNDYKIGTVGRPLAANGMSLEGGEIEVDGAGVFTGYENQEHTPNLTSEKYLSTGDIGLLDGEGYLKLIGRKSEIIKTSTGRKIAPAAIEHKLLRALGAEQSMVVGNGRPCLVAILCFNGPRTPEQLEVLDRELQKLNESLSSYEQVRGVVVLDRLFSMEKGELTRNLKLRRDEIERMHLQTISDLYEQIPKGEAESFSHRTPDLKGPVVFGVEKSDALVGF